jgi:uncharacterized protein (DUF305 family)
MAGALITAALVTSAAVTGCGSGAPSGADPAGSTVPGSTAEHDDADVTFAGQMIPHHTQAVRMADLAAQRAGSDQVKQLAATIQAAQQPEIDQLRTMLAGWGAPPAAPAGQMDGMAGMDHGAAAMPGMMTDADMTGLSRASGVDFDRRFLTMMIAHHQGAVDMSATELAQGRSPEATALARKISAAQRAEIDQMRRLLSG